MVRDLLFFQLPYHFPHIFLGEVTEKNLEIRLLIPKDQGPKSGQRKDDYDHDQNKPSLGRRSKKLIQLFKKTGHNFSVPLRIDGFAKSPFCPFFVIPAKFVPAKAESGNPVNSGSSGWQSKKLSRVSRDPARNPAWSGTEEQAKRTFGGTPKMDFLQSHQNCMRMISS